MAKTREEFFSQPCPVCGFLRRWKQGKRMMRSGGFQYPFFCGQCGYVSTYYTKKAIAEKCVDLTILSPPEDMPICVVCGSIGAELHHWLPRFLSSDYESWPTAWLCVPCHKKWHAIVTPKMHEVTT